MPQISISNFACRRIDANNIEISYDVNNNNDYDIFVSMYTINLWATIDNEINSDTKVLYKARSENSDDDSKDIYDKIIANSTILRKYQINTIQSDNPDKIYFETSPDYIWIEFCIGPYVPYTGRADTGNVGMTGICYESGKNPC